MRETSAPVDPAGYAAVLFDLDGTLYLSGEPLPGAPGFVTACREAGARVGFLTNTSAVGPAACAARLGTAGIEAGVDEIVTAPQAMALAMTADGVDRVACIGGPGMRDALAGAGIEVADVAEVADGWAGPGAAVAVGMDPAVAMLTLHRAADLVAAGAVLYTNTVEAHSPSSRGCLPASGPIVAAILHMVPGADAVVCGKPSRRYADLALAWTGETDGRPVLMVGDNRDTDVALAHLLGWDSLLVLTGASGPATPGPEPTYLHADLRTALRT
jgi:HAD superfamily hydrolase (TIGR01450 family)